MFWIICVSQLAVHPRPAITFNNKEYAVFFNLWNATGVFYK
jgi:hypothetical protein